MSSLPSTRDNAVLGREVACASGLDCQEVALLFFPSYPTSRDKDQSLDHATKMFRTKAPAEKAAITGRGREWDSQDCRAFQDEVLSVGIVPHDSKPNASTRVLAAALTFFCRAVHARPTTRLSPRK
jgi:hypothetical protein